MSLVPPHSHEKSTPKNVFSGAVLTALLVFFGFAAFLIPLAAFHLAQVGSTSGTRSAIRVGALSVAAMALLGLILGYGPLFVSAVASALWLPLLIFTLHNRLIKGRKIWGLAASFLPVVFLLAFVLGFPVFRSADDFFQHLTLKALTALKTWQGVPSPDLSSTPQGQKLMALFSQFQTQMRNQPDILWLQNMATLSPTMRFIWLAFGEGFTPFFVLFFTCFANFMAIHFAVLQMEKLKAVLHYIGIEGSQKFDLPPDLQPAVWKSLFSKSPLAGPHYLVLFIEKLRVPGGRNPPLPLPDPWAKPPTPTNRVGRTALERGAGFVTLAKVVLNKIVQPFWKPVWMTQSFSLFGKTFLLVPNSKATSQPVFHVNIPWGLAAFSSFFYAFIAFSLPRSFFELGAFGPPLLPAHPALDSKMGLIWEKVGESPEFLLPLACTLVFFTFLIVLMVSAKGFLSILSRLTPLGLFGVALLAFLGLDQTLGQVWGDGHQACQAVFAVWAALGLLDQLYDFSGQKFQLVVKSAEDENQTPKPLVQDSKD